MSPYGCPLLHSLWEYLYSEMKHNIQSIYFFIFFSIMVHYRILNIAPCAVQWGVPVGSDGKDSACNAGNPCSFLFIHFTYTSFHLREGSGTHSSTFAWKIPWTKEPGGLQPMGSLRVGHDWVTSLSLFTFMHWRRKWEPTPVFLPGESQGWGSLVGCHLWGCTESDKTEAT